MTSIRAKWWFEKVVLLIGLHEQWHGVAPQTGRLLRSYTNVLFLVVMHHSQSSCSEPIGDLKSENIF